MRDNLFQKVFVILFYCKLIESVNFNGKTPPNAYIIPVTPGQVVVASASWSSSATDLDLHIFQPGRVISDSTSDGCVCACCSSSQTISLTANANGNVVAWAQQWGGAGVTYTISITKNGVVVAGQTTLLSQNASFFKMSVTSAPCTMFLNFTSTGNFQLSFYAPGTLLTGSPIKTMSYGANSGYVDISHILTATGTYDLKVIQNPANPSGGWPSFKYYDGSMECKACSDFIVGCLTCSSSKVCTSCSAGFTLSSGDCLCNLANCQTCNSAGTQCVACNSGFYVNPIQQCSSCTIIPLCLTCTSSTFCTLCDGANFYNTTLLECRPCYEAISDCLDCDTQTVCLACTADKYFDGIICKLCSLTLASCQQCNNALTCQKCAVGTFLNSSNLCQTCPSAINGCSQCSDSSTCTKCDINHILSGASCQLCSSVLPHCLNCTIISSQVHCIVCDKGYFVDQLIYNCPQCNRNVSECEFCDSQLQCTDCNWLYYLSSQTLCDTCNVALSYCLNCTNDGLVCYECTDDRYLLQLQKCDVCTDLINNCSRCSTNYTCIQCQVKYHLLTDLTLGTVKCKFCELSMQGCMICDSAVLCTTVVNDYYFIYASNRTTQKCINQIPNCLRCSSQTVCTGCQTGYYLKNAQCFSCYQAIDFCVQCSNSSICQKCENDYQPFTSGTVSNCTCTKGWYVPRACTSMYGCINARKINTNSKQSTCLMCDSSNHFFYDPTDKKCYCQTGYRLEGDICVQHCGDGTHFNHECDDGNILNLDGCSFDCKVQPEYVCQGQAYQYSQCYLKIQPEIKYLYTVRSDGQNKATVFFSITPVSQLHKRINFTKLIVQNYANITILNTFYDNGRVQVEFSFKNDNYQHNQLDITWSLFQSYNLKTSKLTTFHTQTMRPPLKILQHQNFFNFVFISGQILAYLLLFLLVTAIFFHKMLAVELIVTYQIIYCMGFLSEDNISIFRLFISLRPMLGISQIFQISKISLISPQILRYFSVGRSLLLNLNVSLLIFAFIIFVLIILKIFLLKCQNELKNYSELAFKMQKSMADKKSKSKLQKLKTQIQEQKFRLRDCIFHANRKVVFIYERMVYPFGISLAIPLITMYLVSSMGKIQGQNQMIQSMSTIVFITVLLIIIMIVSFQTRKIWSQHKEPRLKLPFRSINDCMHKQNLNSHSALFLLFGISCSLLSVVSLNTFEQIAVISIPIMTTAYIAYIKFSKPYIDQFHNQALMYFKIIILINSLIILIDFFGNPTELFLQICIFLIILMGYFASLVSFYRIFLQHKHILKLMTIQQLLAQNTKKQRKDVKQTLEFNPYVYQENYRKNISFLADVKWNGELPQQIDNKQYSDQDQSKKQQLLRIKRRLRKQLKAIKLDQNNLNPCGLTRKSNHKFNKL